MTRYQKEKERAREMAVEYSNTRGETQMYMSEYAEICNKFERLGRRYGLLREFRENGIC